MSSHHIVRDEQEPALVVLDPHAVEREILGGLLEWSPTVVVAQQVLPIFLDWGIKVDFVLVNNPTQPIEAPYSDYIIEIPIAAHSSPVDTALRYLANKAHKAVNIIGNPANELIFALPTVQAMDVVLFDTGQRMVHVRSGRYKKWLRSKSQITITPLRTATYITTDGFTQDLKNEPLDMPITLQTENEGITQVISNFKPILVSEHV